MRELRKKKRGVKVREVVKNGKKEPSPCHEIRNASRQYVESLLRAFYEVRVNVSKEMLHDQWLSIVTGFSSR
jgi:hypothetical protein